MDVLEESSQFWKLFGYSLHTIGILLISFVVYYIAAKIFFGGNKCIKGKLALVTGGGSGLGAAIALELAKKGCNLAIADLNIEAAKKTARIMRNWGIKAEAYKVDVSKLEEIEILKQKIENDLGKVNIVVNNAAMLFTRCLESESPETLQKMINVNIMSIMWTTRVFLNSMMQENDGHIVTICSIAGLIGTPIAIPYATTKFAVRGFMESLALDLAYKGYSKTIKTTTAYPSFISTNNEVVKCVKSAINSKYNDMLYTPENVAQKVVNAMRANEETLVIPGYAQYIAYSM